MRVQRQSIEATADGALCEAALVQSAAAGDAAARATLIERYADYAFGLALRLSGRRSETEEIIQDAFVEVLTSLPSLRDAAAFRSWLGQIVVHTTRRRIRRERLGRLLGLADPEPLHVHPLVSRDAPPDVVAETEQLYRALDTLATRPRLAFIMRHAEGRTIDEIATLLGGSRASVKRWLAKAEAHVRRRFQVTRPGRDAEPNRER